MSAGFTSGPWEVRQQRVDGADEVSIGDRNNTIWRNDGQGFYPIVALASVRPSEEGKRWVPMCSIAPEDANLIAAAPSLYEALETICFAIGPLGMRQPGLEQEMLAATCALAQARGEAK